MRIRSTKPEFWRSNTVASLDWADRFVLKGLEAYVDDNGVGKDDVELIAADVFPRDLARDPETVARLSEAITRIAQTGLIIRYIINGERLLYVDRWKDIQRVDKPNKGRFPRPDGSMEYDQPVIRDSLANPREGVAPGTGEQGNRGTEADDDAREPEPETPPPDLTEPIVVDVIEPPLLEVSTKRPKRHPTDASRFVVRQVLGSAGYPRTITDRLAVQVGDLAHAGHADDLIRAALGEWDRRPNCDKPEFLPTVLGDLIKRSRAAPASNAHDDKVAGFLAYANPQKELA